MCDCTEGVLRCFRTHDDECLLFSIIYDAILFGLCVSFDIYVLWLLVVLLMHSHRPRIRVMNSETTHKPFARRRL